MVHSSFLRNKVLPIWLTLLAVFLAGCGGGQSPILGGTGNAQATPRVTSVTPSVNAVNVSIATRTVTATFTKPMDPATLTAASFKLECPVGSPLAGEVSYTAVGNRATLTLPAATTLPSNASCTATLSKSVKDTWGIALDADFVWSFTTGAVPDTTAPTVTGTINDNGATNVAFNTKIGATFSEAMDPLSITTAKFLVKESISGASVGGALSYLGVSAVFTPAVALTPATRYTITIKGGVGGVTDLAGNVMAADFVNSWTTGAAPDTTAPTVTGTINANGATNVAFNAKAGATFSEGMDPLTVTTNNFLLKSGSTLVAGTLSYSGVNAVFTPLVNLAPATLYTLTIKGGVGGVADLAGNVMVNDFVISWTTGAAPDTTAPTVTGTINANGATNVAFNSKEGVTFSEGMNPLTVTTSTFLVKNGSSPVVGTVSYSGVNAVFTPLVNLAPATQYTVTIKGGAGGVADLAGNAMAADYVYSWTTGAAPDTTAPTVTGTINANGATNVAFNAKEGVTFSEGMNPLTVTTTNFLLQNARGLVAGTVGYSGVNAVFTPLTALEPSTLYMVTIKGGVGGVADLAGNAMAADYVYSWTTGAAPDTTAPTVTGTINANGATNVAFNAKEGVTFSEGMNPLTVTTSNFLVKNGSTPVVGTVSYSGVNAVFTPLVNLAPATLYTVTIKGGVGGVADLAGNVMVADYVYSWTTGAVPDTTAPAVTGTINANGATNVAFNTKEGATFSERMNPLTVTTANFLVKNGSTPVVGTLSYSGVNAVFTPLVNLAPATLYTVTIKGGVGGVADLAGNVMAADYVYSWTTGAAPDTTAPTVVSVSPSAGATGVPVNSSVRATFNEAMDPLTISTASFTVAGVTGTVSFDALTRTATFKPGSDLANNTLYTATVTTAAKDLAGNALAVNKVWTFTTAAAVVVVVPAVDLAGAAPFGTFGGTAGMTNTGTLTLVNGDIGTIATGTSGITGFHDTTGDIYTESPANRGAVSGKIYTCTNSTIGPTSAGPNAAACAIATKARLDAQTAYLALVAKAPLGASPAPGANLAGLTLLPGVYKAPNGSFLIEGGNLTLDAQGDANATWVFQMATTLTVGGPGAAFPQSIILAGGAQPKNVFWQVGSFATINAAGGGTMVGTIISQAGASFSTAGNVNIVTLLGRALSLGASVTLVNTVITVPAP